MTHPRPKLTALARERIARARENKATRLVPWPDFLKWCDDTGKTPPPAYLDVGPLKSALNDAQGMAEAHKQAVALVDRAREGKYDLDPVSAASLIAAKENRQQAEDGGALYRDSRMRELKATLKRKDRTPMPRRDLATMDPRLAKFCEALARDIGIPVDKLYRRSLYYSDRTVNRLRRQRYRRTRPLRTAWLAVKWWVR